MQKLHFYGIEINEGEECFLYQFPFKKDLQAWINERYEEYATDPIVRRILRRMAQDNNLTFPVEIE